jgi:hypothetical protein
LESQSPTGFVQVRQYRYSYAIFPFNPADPVYYSNNNDMLAADGQGLIFDIYGRLASAKVENIKL